MASYAVSLKVRPLLALSQNKRRMITDLNGHPVGFPNFYGMPVAPGRPDRIAADDAPTAADHGSV
ncbi:hypothetical protein GCM10017710_15540 [Arthrobacter ramosus]